MIHGRAEIWRAGVAVPSLVGDLRPGASRGKSRAGAAQRVARAVARPARPAGRGCPAGSGPTAMTAAAVAQAERAGRFVVDLRLARLRAADPGRRHRPGALSDRHRRDLTPRSPAAPSTPSRPRRPSGRRAPTIIGAPPRGLTQFDVNLPTGILPDGGPFTEAGDKTWHTVPGHRCAGGPGHREGVHLHRRGRGRRRHHHLRR